MTKFHFGLVKWSRKILRPISSSFYQSANVFSSHPCLYQFKQFSSSSIDSTKNVNEVPTLHQIQKRIKTSIFRGVSLSSVQTKRAGQPIWQSSIFHAGKHTILGHFSSEFIAAKVYDLACIYFRSTAVKLNLEWLPSSCIFEAAASSALPSPSATAPSNLQTMEPLPIPLYRPSNEFEIDLKGLRSFITAHLPQEVIHQVCSLQDRFARKRKTTSSFKGVSCKDGVYVPLINLPSENGVRQKSTLYTFGRYTEEIYAAKAYDIIAYILYDKNANLNFPEMNYSSLISEEKRKEYKDLLSSNNHRKIIKLNLTKIAKTYVPTNWSEYQKQKATDYKGVTWITSLNSYAASIVINGHLIRIGLFENEIDAARAYDAVLMVMNPTPPDRRRHDLSLNFPLDEPVVTYPKELQESSPLPTKLSEINKLILRRTVNFLRPFIPGLKRKSKQGRYLGVYKQPNGQWMARFMIQNKYYVIGHYKDEEAAARAYDARKLQLLGPSAVTNFGDSEASTEPLPSWWRSLPPNVQVADA
jgi:AP2 domain